jgi:hypothetical protein
MENFNPETKPLFFKIGKKLTVIALGDPSLTLIEVHDALGFLLAESCYDSMEGSKLHLETVTWVRHPYQKGENKYRSFAEVVLYRHSSDRFVAQDLESKNYFPYPSSDSYAVIYLSKKQYDKFFEEIQKEAIEQMIKSLKPVIRKVPNFSFKGDILKAPRRYADAISGRFDRPILQV